ncbi:MAG: valine--tRNA ligase [Alphaproteobacteria bacterium]|nr:valine--tRNA ligase [Alphaproteobacteria bacterium]
MFPELDKNFDTTAVEEKCKTLWDETRIHDYDPDSDKALFSVDTPPPYVSAAHLHAGHAASYTQAEIVIRYKRMTGHNIYYPMGFDDNGLPTERYVEQTHKVNKKKISRSDFRKLCIEETQKGAKSYEKLWRALGLSVDWSTRYSTIDDLSRHTAQKSFLDLYKKGLVYRANEPVLWDTHFETALAQADLETIDRKGKMYDIAFTSAETSENLVISTTRPEFISACVAMYFHPEDTRYQHLAGTNAVVPLSGGRTVPIKTSEEVDKDFGTGLMQVCTFGDGEDVKKWKADKLDTRIILGADGKMTALAGKYEGLDVPTARKRIVEDLKESGLVVAEKVVDQSVSVGERSEIPVEFIMTPQWFIDVLGHKERFKTRAAELKWFPDWMKVRLDHWIDGLKYDWNISRQRFYGVPFPVWFVQETGEVIVADEDMLPVDPLESDPPQWAQEKYKGMTIVPDADVMDTWMTSSLTPLINANWAECPGRKGSMKLYPMDLRVQAFEIIRTWLFYTLIKSDYHTDSLPWKNVMISGWGLNEQGKKISKRDLEKFTDANGFNRYDPYSLITKYGADAIRWWAASAQLGKDLRFHEREVKDGRKIVVKLWNVARLAFLYMNDFDPTQERIPYAERPLEDRWILSELNALVARMTDCFERYDYATAREALHKFFWMTYCDTYLELVKARFWENTEASSRDQQAGQATLFESLHVLTKLLAPYLPYITEEIYQQASRFGEDAISLHVSAWPERNAAMAFDGAAEMAIVLDILAKVRKLRSERQIGAGAPLETLILDAGRENDLKPLEGALLNAARAAQIVYRPLTVDEGVGVDITASAERRTGTE